MKFLVGIIFAFSMTACVNDDVSDAIPDQNESAEIEFEIDMFNNPELTKNPDADETLGSCRTDDELKKLANAKNLYLNVTIDGKSISKPIVWTGIKYISDPFIMAKGEHIISMATITTKTNNETEVLFSCVGETSKYKNYVPETLPITVNIGSEETPLFQKSTVDLFVLCIVDESPLDFGFVKWNVHFSKLYCVPFIMNYCAEGGEDFVAAGTINIKNGTYDRSTGVFTPATGNETPVKWAVVDNTVEFISGGELAKICFVDTYEIDDKVEFYQFTVNLTYPVEKTIVGYQDTYNLRFYWNIKFSKIWDTKYRMLHFNFCECRTWFFPNDCTLSNKAENTIDFRKIHEDKYDDNIEVKKPGGVFEKGTRSLDRLENNFDEVTLKKGTIIRYKEPLHFSSSITMTNYAFGDFFTGDKDIDDAVLKAGLYKMNIYENDSFDKPFMSVFSRKDIKTDPSPYYIPTCFRSSKEGYFYYEYEILSDIPGVRTFRHSISAYCPKLPNETPYSADISFDIENEYDQLNDDELY